MRAYDADKQAIGHLPRWKVVVRNQFLASLLLATVLALLAVACGGGEGAPTSTPEPTTTPTPVACTPSTYTVQPGDTLSEVAERLVVPQGELIRANGIVDTNMLFAGQELIIPCAIGSGP